MTPFTQAMSLALLHFLWQGSVIALIAASLLMTMRGSSAKARYLVSCGALALMTLTPVITTMTLYQAVSPSATRTVLAPQNADLSIASARLDRPSVAPSIAPYFASFSQNTLNRWVLPLWTLGVVFFSLRTLWGWRDTRKLLTGAVAADSVLLETLVKLRRAVGMTRPARILVSSQIEVPSVVGFIRPMILIPVATLAGLTTQQLEAVIAHELAHILRYDHWVNLAQTFAEAVLFYHPAVWWISSRIRDERELCCDDLAVATCGDALCYARALTAIEKLRAEQHTFVLASNGGSLLYRIARITGHVDQVEQLSLQCRVHNSWPVATALFVILLCIPASLLWANPATDHSLAAQSQPSTGRVLPLPVAEPSTNTRPSVNPATAPAIKESRAPKNILAQAKTRNTVARPIATQSTSAFIEKRYLPEQLEEEFQTVRKTIFDERSRLSTVQQASVPNMSTSEFLQNYYAIEAFVKPFDALRKAAIEAPEGTPRATAADAKLRDALRAAAKTLPALHEERIKLELAARPDQIEGRTVHLVAIVDVPEPKRQELRAQLPVQTGQILTQAAINQAFHVLRDFDPDLRMLLIRGDGRDVDFIVSAKPR